MENAKTRREAALLVMVVFVLGVLLGGWRTICLASASSEISFLRAPAIDHRAR